MKKAIVLFLATLAGALFFGSCGHKKAVEPSADEFANYIKARPAACFRHDPGET